MVDNIHEIEPVVKKESDIEAAVIPDILNEEEKVPDEELKPKQIF